MVFSSCPHCGEGMDGQPNLSEVSGEKEWYARHHPGVPVGSEILSPCFDCRHPYVVGERIKQRTGDSRTVFVVCEVKQRPGPLLTLVVMDEAGRKREFAVTEIQLISDSVFVEPREEDQDIRKKDGYF